MSFFESHPPTASLMQFVSPELTPVLERAAAQYADMSPSEFDLFGVLKVSSSRLRSLGLIETEVWAKVPAHTDVRVRREVDGALEVRVLVPGFTSMPSMDQERFEG